MASAHMLLWPCPRRAAAGEVGLTRRSGDLAQLASLSTRHTVC
jgi:hypothetical protein